VSNSYRTGIRELLQELGVDPVRGLSEAETARRLARHGPNELIERGGRSPWMIFLGQMTGTMVLILVVAAVISAFLGDDRDAVAILAIVILNAVLGFQQEYKAEKAMAALKKMAVPSVRVRRDGRLREISARELVPGDVVLLEAGNRVPADCRLIEAANLRVQESALTGESEPVDKSTSDTETSELPLAERRHMTYMGTAIAYGRGIGVVTETGMDTELGKIASMIQTVRREPTPLQRRLDHLGKALALIAFFLVGVIFVLGLFRGEEIRVMFLTAISMAVAAGPEGLPAVVTIALALGAQRMFRRRALIRKLSAVETLGSVTVICSDKTGTLTENRMTVTILDVAGHRVDLIERLRGDEPVFESEDLPGEKDPALALLLAGGALCNDAELVRDPDKPGAFEAVGDPTEGALAVAAARAGLSKSGLEKLFPRVAEIPFDSQRKRMTTIHRFPHSKSDVPQPLRGIWRWSREAGEIPFLAFTKGAVDGLVSISDKVWVNDRAEPLSDGWRVRIVAANDRLAQSGMRVLGVSFRPLSSAERKSLKDAERDQIFVGMAGMIDPARPEVKEAVATCKRAGVRPMMITGDHPLTARHVARELGIAEAGRILIGPDLDRLPPEKLIVEVERVPVYARVSPEHKLKIVQALQERGELVAMTGDGVNDAPALKKADIGVAMGITGTDLSKEAADMVLQDDNFATIVAAVEEGRVIYDNIRKFMRYILTANSGELWVMLLAPFLGMPLPLLPLQILWINLVTDGLPALALVAEPPEGEVMRRPPIRPTESLFDTKMRKQVVWAGLLMGIVSLGIGYGYWLISRPEWQTLLFTTMTLSQMGLALAVRSGRDSLFRIGFLSNKPLVGAVALTFFLQLAVIYLPPLQGVFTTVSLNILDLAVCLAASTLLFCGVEAAKWLGRLKEESSSPVTW
jgi:Ca2+-transporting ATPase